ncbi:hypothetical protein CDL12_24953 [Handroanthus impetiginosus]|uniref:Uncharacterized protein n=2 Tax=Handroanthus impetiginosus TaxID=429701 RepID=A0A2G9GB57_9LAMI|nr:hypothetical protein CDL12_24953 [Handroanthus impetiginosus]
MMVCTSLSSSPLTRLIPATHKPPQPPPAANGGTVERILQVGRRETSRRVISVVTRAGPSTTSYIFAFVFPLSLLAVTIFTSVRIADKLDEKFFEELAVNEAILEAEGNDDEDDDGEVPIPPEKEPTPIRSRNRPKREVEP